MQVKLVFAALLLTLPVFAGAAGFAKQSLFLSRSSVTEGETVLVHAVVSNESSTTFKGELEVREGDTKIGTVPVTLAKEEAQTVSVSWKPAAGSHTLDAELTTSDGTVVEKQTATFTIKTKAAAQGTTTVDSSADVQQKIADLSPQVAAATAPIFSTVDIVRQKSAEVLDKGIAWSNEKKGEKTVGEVLGESTKNGPQGIIGTIGYLLASLFGIILSILLYVIGHAGIFYPVLAIGFLWMLWKLYKRMRRPKFEPVDM